ncbi:hypothetical protein Peur_050063 [Populus x canadensis]
MLKSEASQYVEFNSVDASFIGDGNGKLWNVPDSRAAMIKDKSLTLMGKNQLMRIILYAIAMTDYDQEDMEACRDLLRTKDGMDCLALHRSPVGSCDSVKSIRSPAPENFCDTGFANAGDGDAYGKGFVSASYCLAYGEGGMELLQPRGKLQIREISGSYKALCDDANQGKRLLNAAMNALLTVPNSVNSESSSTVQHENIEEKPTVLWRELYIQEITMGQFNSTVSLASMPNGSLYCNTTIFQMKL